MKKLIQAIAARLRMRRPSVPTGPLVHYRMWHEFGPPEHSFWCAPEDVGRELARIVDYGLTDQCREAFAHAAAQGHLPARYGQFWVLAYGDLEC